MNTYNINDAEFINSDVYKNFLSNNPSRGFLNIRAYAASQAVPVSNLKVVVSTIINNNKVIFFEGLTNSSGTISGITLPTPKLDNNNLDMPRTIMYEITVSELNKSYKVNMYENVSVIQNISVAPEGGM